MIFIRFDVSQNKAEHVHADFENVINFYPRNQFDRDIVQNIQGESKKQLPSSVPFFLHLSAIEDGKNTWSLIVCPLLKK